MGWKGGGRCEEGGRKEEQVENNSVLRILYQEPNISRIITGKRLRWAGLIRLKLQKDMHANI
jgi:hypothetical protein